MFRRKAFLHWYTGEGMDEMEFTEAESNMNGKFLEQLNHKLNANVLYSYLAQALKQKVHIFKTLTSLGMVSKNHNQKYYFILAKLGYEVAITK